MSEKQPKKGAVVVLKDPGVERGRFRVLPRTDGKYVVYDADRPLGDRTVAVSSSVEGATRAAEKLAADESRRGGA